MPLTKGWCVIIDAALQSEALQSDAAQSVIQF
jgi:hypothetical protein